MTQGFGNVRPWNCDLTPTPWNDPFSLVQPKYLDIGRGRWGSLLSHGAAAATGIRARFAQPKVFVTTATYPPGEERAGRV